MPKPRHKRDTCSDCGADKDARASKCWNCYASSNPEPPNKKEVNHGDRLMYARGCRCDSCTKGSREDRAVYGGYLTNEQRRALPCEECGDEEKLPGVTVGKECFALRTKRYNRNSSKNILSYDEYLKMSEDQNNVCMICEQPETRISKSGRPQDLSEDHIHGTDIVRGLLCSNCNPALGLFFDNPDLLRKAALYLEKFI